MKKAGASILFGPDVIRHLLPHRRPFLMVDVVTAYERTPLPTLWASRLISANEPIFEGHFPGLHLWPGVYTIEGLGQTSNLLLILWAYQNAWEERGLDPGEILAALGNLERGYQLKPGFRPELSKNLVDALRAQGGSDGAWNAASRMGMSAAVDVKLLKPVFAGQRLDYRSTQTHLFDQMVRFEVEAEVEGQVVARGTMTSTRGIPPLPPSAV